MVEGAKLSEKNYIIVSLRLRRAAMAISPKQLDALDHSRDSAGLTYVYPVVSRRAGGLSIGINLNPNNACNWRCIYCQVPNLSRGAAPPIDMALLERELRAFIRSLQQGTFMEERLSADVRRIADVALSGNGEPTSAREFPDVIVLVASVLRDSGLGDNVTVRVITNGSLVSRAHVKEGLRRLGAIGGEAWFKLDAGTTAGFLRVNSVKLSAQTVLRNLRACAELCPTWVQTCLFELDGQPPSEQELTAYLALLARARSAGLRGVLLYGLARQPLQPEARRLARLSAEGFAAIARRIRALGLPVRIST